MYYNVGDWVKMTINGVELPYKVVGDFSPEMDDVYCVCENTINRCWRPELITRWYPTDEEIKSIEEEFNFSEPEREDPEKRVLFHAIKGTLPGTVAIFPLDSFSEYILSEEQSNSDLLDMIYDILPDNERHLVEYHSKFSPPDDVDVWYTLIS